MIPKTHHYWLTHAHVPLALLVEDSLGEFGKTNPLLSVQTQPDQVSDLVEVDLEIQAGRIAQIVPSGSLAPSELPDIPRVDLKRRLVWCCFVELHTHLDKGQIWSRQSNPDGSFANALAAVQADHERWQPEELYRRMEFGLKCAYAHGTHAIRTHLDASGSQAAMSLEVFKHLQQEWADRITLQAVSLVPLEYYTTPAGKQLADQLAEAGAVLGGLPQMGTALDQQLDRVFQLAIQRGLDLDFHTDESGDPGDTTLRHVAEAVLRHEFSGQVVCGHCCSLAVQTWSEALKTMEAVQRAGIGIVSLPMCNLYLQDRNQDASQHLAQTQDAPATGERTLAYFPSFPTQTPRWRGITLVHELKQLGIPVAFSSDNCRDPFYAYGDYDGWEVFNQAVRIAQLDAPYGDWCRSCTTQPANLMGLPTHGRIGVGLPADLIIFKARSFNELLSRSQFDRVVLRRGQPIDTTLPDYAELDDLFYPV